MEDINYKELLELREDITSAVLLPDEAQSMISQCKLKVISNTAFEFIDIVISIINKNGKFSLFAAFIVLPRIKAAIKNLISENKKCKENT